MKKSFARKVRKVCLRPAPGARLYRRLARRSPTTAAKRLSNCSKPVRLTPVKACTARGECQARSIFSIATLRRTSLLPQLLILCPSRLKFATGLVTLIHSIVRLPPKSSAVVLQGQVPVYRHLQLCPTVGSPDGLHRCC